MTGPTSEPREAYRIAEAGFGASAEAFDRGRPDYPGAVGRWLAERLALRPGVRVADLAAGTGKLTRVLAGTGAWVVAIEPVPAMREALSRSLPGIPVVAGLAESMPFASSSLDVVTVGQAFHWFDGLKALAEIERVLRPGGALALVWNRRPIERSALHQQLTEIMAPYRDDAPAHASGKWREAFAGRELQEWTHDFVQRLDADGLADRVGSTSFIAALDDPERERVLAQVRAIAGEGEVEVPYECEIHVWRPT